MKRLRRDNHKEGEGLCQGVTLYTYDRKDEDRMRERVILFGHPSEDICLDWMNRINQQLRGTRQTTILHLYVLERWIYFLGKFL